MAKPRDDVSVSHLTTEQSNTSHHPPASPFARRAGFTLMEVNLALLIMAVGLLGLFSLFPVGLRQGNAASSDNTQAAFAALVLNAMRANAQAVTNWSDWLVLTNGVNLGVTSSSPSDRKITVPQAGGASVDIVMGGAPIANYLVKNQYLQYVLHLETGPAGANDLIRTAWIQVSTRRYTDLTRSPKYATSFVYMGM